MVIKPFTEIIEEQRSTLIALTGSALMILFWKTGKALNECFQHKNSGSNFMNAFPDRLITCYGPCFSKSNLKKMRQLARQFPDISAMEQHAAILNRPYICSLLKIKSLEAGLLFSACRPLIDPLKRAPVLKNKATSIGSFQKIPATEKELFETISRLVKEYSRQQNRWLNEALNEHFREIGDRINREISSNNKIILSRDVFIQQLSEQLENGYGKNYSKRQLNKMAEFAGQFEDKSVASRINNLVSWQHILILLSLPGLEKKLFYARLAAAQGLSARRLQSRITQNIYGQTKGAGERERATTAVLKNPVRKRAVTREKNAVITITTSFINLGEDADKSKAVTPVFKNPYFRSFIDAFKPKG